MELPNSGNYAGNFPFDKERWQNIISRIKDNYNDEDGDASETVKKALQDIFENDQTHQVIVYPRAPIFTRGMSVLDKVNIVQTYLNQLQYNHTGTQFFVVKMNRSISRLYDVAKEIIKNPLPIKCLEAAAVSLYLTATIPNIDRFTIRFKSQFGKVIHRHIVLGIYYNSNYGAVGLSRRKSLMYKPLKYKSLADLIIDFNNSYAECCHTLKKVKLSLPITSDLHTCDTISWNYFVLTLTNVSEEGIKTSLMRYSRELRTKFNVYTTVP